MDQKIDYGKMPLEEIIKSLDTNLETGLTSARVQERVKSYGYNEVSGKKESPFLQFVKHFWGLTPWMLELTILLTIVLHKYLDMYMIVALLVLNAIIGFIEEYRASNAVEALKQKLKVRARVLRNGQWQMIAAREVVPGDIIRIRAGDFVPADLKLADGDIEVDQSALTGESLTITKKTGDMVFSGSIVKSGEATALVVLTGSRTYFGTTTELVQLAKPRLHVEDVTGQIVTWLLVIVGVLVAIALVVSWTTGVDIINIIPLMLILLVSAIPVGLPAMFTISMALGSLELGKRGVLITRLNAAEDAGSMDTLCADKTGTLTMNKLSIVDVLPMAGFTAEDVIMYGALASEEANNDPIDLAFLGSAVEKGITLFNYRKDQFIPFDPQTRRTECIVERDNERLTVVKGAVNVIADATHVDMATMEDKMNAYAQRGYRTLAVAMGKDEANLGIVGLVALYDKPRPEVKGLIQELRDLGVSFKMLTGDALPIAKEMARQIGLGDAITHIGDISAQFERDPASGANMVEASDGFAEIYPQDKFVLVKSLQLKHHIVGMTGDGVNDAPALKQAEVGIAVSSATDVAKAASSAVLTGEGLSNIVEMVKIGRTIFERILTWVFNKVLKTFEIQIFVIFVFFLTGRFVVSAFEMVLLLVLTDFITLTLSTDNARWSQKPSVWDVSGIFRASIILGIVGTCESLVIFYIGRGPLGLAPDFPALKTFSFAILFYLSTIKVFIVRERGHFWQSAPSKALLFTILADMILAGFLVTVGIPGLKAIPLFDTAVVIVASCLFAFLVDEPIKYLLLNKRARPVSAGPASPGNDAQAG